MATGVFDSVSVVIRLTLRANDHARSPARPRGCHQYVFIGFSGEFGAFGSATAALFGPTLSVVGGGFATLIVMMVRRGRAAVAHRPTAHARAAGPALRSLGDNAVG